MLTSGYSLSPKTKNPHSLDSWLYGKSDNDVWKLKRPIPAKYLMKTNKLIVG